MVDDQPSPTESYSAVRQELSQALRSLNEADATLLVPACPNWTVKDVAAHLAGLNAELLANVPGPLGSDEATGRQVGDRASANLNEVLDEWSSMSEAISERFAVNHERATALLADLVVHVYDLEELLNQPTTYAAAATPRSAGRYVSLLQERVADELQIALTVEFADAGTWRAPHGSTQVTVRATSHDFLRGVTGRLRREQVEALEWSSDPTTILDQAWNQYGPFRA